MFINETYLGRFCTVCIKLATILAVMTIIMSQVVFAQSSNTDILSKNLSATVLFAQGKSYHDGNGVSADITKAIAYYEQAAKLGNTDAKLNLGYIYFTGQGGEQNYAKARQYYLQAAGTGDTAAQENLGLMYEHGLGEKPIRKLPKYGTIKAKEYINQKNHSQVLSFNLRCKRWICAKTLPQKP